MVAITLHKQYGDGLYYYNKNVEVDFYVPEEKMAIQVCYSLSDEQTLNREVEALIKLKKAFGLDKMLIISRDEEESLVYRGEPIEVIPVWKWLL
ncbi:MAG: ATP-binding protein [Bacteroidales bacterium]|nr:ATP-binding protein [Bacteroidales bacterium]